MKIYILFIFCSWDDDYDVSGVYESKEDAYKEKAKLDEKNGFKLYTIDKHIIEEHEVIKHD